jgi:SAM-dependent methyltransferase
LLDVGCGGGWLLESMKSLGWTVEGVDLDPQAVAGARSRGLQVHLGQVEQLRLPAERFDVVTMSHYIEHVYQPAVVIAACYRLLKPGGRLVMVTPNTRSLGHRLYRKDWMHLDPPRHLHLFNPGTLADTARRGGFRKLTAWTSLRDAYGMFLGSRSIRRSGRYAMGASQSVPARLWARGAELFEWLALKFSGELGEEIVVVAEKE